MLIRIDPSSDRPIYAQIASAVEKQIAGGALKAGDRLPSARALSSTLGVNMHTVLRAYAQLQESSQVEMRRGRGGVVVSGTPDMKRVARQLVATARRNGLTKAELDELIWKAWN
jgi:GntR family transcriptional regulator